MFPKHKFLAMMKQDFYKLNDEHPSSHAITSIKALREAMLQRANKVNLATISSNPI